MLRTHTCGELNKGTQIFNYNFTGWNVIEYFPNYDESKYDQYLTWSINNVLDRGVSSSTTDYWLNQYGASYDICLDVHRNKAKALFPNKEYKIVPNNKDMSKKYHEFLTTNMKIDDQVANMVGKIVNK